MKSNEKELETIAAMKIKVEKCDVFGYMHGVSIKGTELTSRNISNYDLYKMPRKSTDKEDVYKLDKKDKRFYIVHNKATGDVDWYNSLE